MNEQKRRNESNFISKKLVMSESIWCPKQGKSLLCPTQFDSEFNNLLCRRHWLHKYTLRGIFKNTVFIHILFWKYILLKENNDDLFWFWNLFVCGMDFSQFYFHWSWTWHIFQSRRGQFLEIVLGLLDKSLKMLF